MIHFINEDGNSKLRHRVFPLTKEIKKHLQNTLKNYNGDKSVEGYKRLCNLLSMENGIKYNEMKRLKNFFDNYNGSEDSVEFILNGGEPMKLWIDATLNLATTVTQNIKQAEKMANIKNIRPTDVNNTKDRQNKTTKPTQIKAQTSNVNNSISDNNLFKFENKKINKIICINEEQAKILKKINEAQDNNFSFDELSNINSFKGKYDYCIQHIGQPCGKGSSRVVFQLSDEKILKLAFNKKGIAQNEAEDMTYNYDTAPKIFECDNDYQWLVAEYVLPAKAQDFKICTGLAFKEFCKFIRSCYKHRFNKYDYDVYSIEEYCEFMENNEDLMAFDDFIGNYEPPIGDLLRIKNYGMVLRDNHPTIVVLDNGLTHEVWKTYYS